jgi:DNA-3-methyladenine glycosylase II
MAQPPQIPGRSHSPGPQPTPAYWNEACRDLAARDSTLDRIIGLNREHVLRGSGDAFRTLVNAIVGQQISVAAAAGIWGRLTAAFPDMSPPSLATADPDELRTIGLSGRKVEYVRGVAEAFASGEIDDAAWHDWTNEEISGQLTNLRGIGPWTADMMLIFHMRRPDVLPLGDIGLVNAAARLYGWDTAGADGLPARRERLAEYAERWRPWRTVATWFIWLELDADPVIY